MSRRLLRASFVSLVFALPTIAQAQSLMVADSGAGDRIMLFDGSTGALIDANWITDLGQPFAFTTPKEAVVVGNQIWVPDQVVDQVHRFDMSRTYLGSITTDAGGNTLDNIRGLGTDGTNAYLTRFHSNSALRGVVTINVATATATGFFAAGAAGSGLFDAEPFQGDLLLSNASGGNNIERWTTAGAFVNNFATTITFPQQVATMPDGSIIAVSSIAASGVEGVYHFETTGALRRYIDTEVLKGQFGEQVPRGAWQLLDGNYLIATSIGVFKYDVAGNTYSQMLGGVDAQYINPFVIPEPSSLGLVACAALMGIRRRR